jgi:hypothetical protein
VRSFDLIVIARSGSDEAIQLSCRGKAGLLRFARNCACSLIR